MSVSTGFEIARYWLMVWYGVWVALGVWRSVIMFHVKFDSLCSWSGMAHVRLVFDWGCCVLAGVLLFFFMVASRFVFI